MQKEIQVDGGTCTVEVKAHGDGWLVEVTEPNGSRTRGAGNNIDSIGINYTHNEVQEAVAELIEEVKNPTPKKKGKKRVK